MLINLFKSTAPAAYCHLVIGRATDQLTRIQMREIEIKAKMRGNMLAFLSGSCLCGLRLLSLWDVKRNGSHLLCVSGGQIHGSCSVRYRVYSTSVASCLLRSLSCTSVTPDDMV